MLRSFYRYFSNVRPESAKLRRYLLDRDKVFNNEYKCSMCLYNFPLSLLHVAHLKPRNTMFTDELLNFNNIELMCKLCHSLYDYGHIGVNYNSIIVANDIILKYDHLCILKNIGQPYCKYNSHNSKFLNWHYENIFIK
jgi:hypothetical protein